MCVCAHIAKSLDLYANELFIPDHQRNVLTMVTKDNYP